LRTCYYGIPPNYSRCDQDDIIVNWPATKTLMLIATVNRKPINPFLIWTNLENKTISKDLSKFVNRAYLITNRNKIKMRSQLTGNYTLMLMNTRNVYLWIVWANLGNQETISKNILYLVNRAYLISNWGEIQDERVSLVARYNCTLVNTVPPILVKTNLSNKIIDKHYYKF
jgi:hypothetical protein